MLDASWHDADITENHHIVNHRPYWWGKLTVMLIFIFSRDDFSSSVAQMHRLGSCLGKSSPEMTQRIGLSLLLAKLSIVSMLWDGQLACDGLRLDAQARRIGWSSLFLRRLLCNEVGSCGLWRTLFEVSRVRVSWNGSLVLDDRLFRGCCYGIDGKANLTKFSVCRSHQNYGCPKC